MYVITLLFISIFLCFDSVLRSGAKMSQLHTSENVHTLFSLNFFVPKQKLLKIDVLYAVQTKLVVAKYMYRDFLANSIINCAHAISSGDSRNYFAICITPVYKNINICWWEGNNLIYCKKTTSNLPPLRQSKKLVYFQPSVSLICNV